MSVFFVTGHDASAPRKVDFHFWAQSLEKAGITVDFMTVGLSNATAFKRNARHFSKPFNTWVSLSKLRTKFVWKPLFHPFSLNNPTLDRLTRPLFKLYPALLPRSVKERIARAQVIVIESGVGLMLVRSIAALAPQAKLIYTVSDRIETLTFHPLILEAERDAIAHFDLIRVPAAVMKESFPDSAPVSYIPPGLDTRTFDRMLPNPYAGGKNAISIGDMLFNASVLETLARNFPDWTFHLFGKKARLAQPLANVIEHGEKPFDELIGYLKHADIGIAPYHDAPNVGYISQSSLKMVQYTYCQLPIVAPAFAAPGRSHVLPFAARADSASVVAAFTAAIAYDRSQIDRTQVMNWDAVTQLMFERCAPAHAA